MRRLQRVQLLKKGKVKHKRLKLPPFQRFEADPSSVNPSSERMHYKGSPTKEVVPLCHSNEELHHVMYWKQFVEDKWNNKYYLVLNENIINNNNTSQLALKHSIADDNRSLYQLNSGDFRLISLILRWLFDLHKLSWWNELLIRFTHLVYHQRNWTKKNKDLRFPVVLFCCLPYEGTWREAIRSILKFLPGL